LGRGIEWLPTPFCRSPISRRTARGQEADPRAARAYGLDFFPVIFEMCDYEQMNQIAAYGGFPQRYPHWRFGMEYERLRKQHFYGLGRIYEMVINNDPCYAYLQESNALVDQKLVIAHVYGHSDFFKNNLWFSQTNRKMMDEMANHATHVRKHIEKHGARSGGEMAGCLPERRASDRSAQHVSQARADR
jgi:stage V sporulation protein R